MRTKKEKYAVIIPKHDDAKKRLEYHGEKWLLRGTKLIRDEEYFVFRSRDGKKCIHVNKKNDNDFTVRLMD